MTEPKLMFMLNHVLQRMSDKLCRCGGGDCVRGGGVQARENLCERNQMFTSAHVFTISAPSKKSRAS